ncbi:hypothetical protein D3C80_1701340 [compost metagenome]
MYGIGYLINVDKLEALIEKYGRFLRLKKEDIRKADHWFDRYGYWTVLFCRLIPVIRSLISIPAGMSKMKFGLFLLFTTVGTLAWNIILVTVGAALGGSWETILHYMDIYSYVAYSVIGIAALVGGYLLMRKLKKRTS